MMTENQFMDAQENICEQFSADKITLEEGIESLVRLGFWEHEARDMLQEYIA